MKSIIKFIKIFVVLTSDACVENQLEWYVLSNQVTYADTIGHYRQHCGQHHMALYADTIGYHLSSIGDSYRRRTLDSKGCPRP